MYDPSPRSQPYFLPCYGSNTALVRLESAIIPNSSTRLSYEDDDDDDEPIYAYARAS